MSSGNLLTVLDVAEPDPEDDALAVLQLRRLANQHGCHGDEPGENIVADENHCWWPEPDCERCRDANPGAHNADVEYLHEWLQMIGLEPYDAMPRTGFVSQPVVNYERPGGSR